MVVGRGTGVLETSVSFSTPTYLRVSKGWNLFKRWSVHCRAVEEFQKSGDDRSLTLRAQALQRPVERSFDAFLWEASNAQVLHELDVGRSDDQTRCPKPERFLSRR
jgi:hypothetical protein